MFKPTENIDTAFRTMRVFMLVVVIGSILVSVYAVYTNSVLSAKAQDKVYVLSNGKAVEVFASSRKENIGVEARDHVVNFHSLFFSLDPDEKAIQSSIRKALYLADATAKKQYDDLLETGYIAGLISGNVSQQLIVDSVQLATVAEPYAFRLFGKLRIIRPTSVVTRNLLTQGYLRTIARSEHNPHGFLIERWEIIDNKDINVEVR